MGETEKEKMEGREEGKKEKKKGREGIDRVIKGSNEELKTEGHEKSNLFTGKRNYTCGRKLQLM